ncbi:hypothetical protein GCM10009676_01770 [Prauserella halophila]|uniref:PepSY domain-containing protein n=1 Tax=Prauserella halophila TaxID=185641 RepID=A0ABP4GJM2_9PSEU|nr:PepSY-associated TM helix domain-containing protein [Prauserella halophila]MCP2234481.1 PepSY-associated TM region [Prauserella halophila]
MSGTTLRPPEGAATPDRPSEPAPRGRSRWRGALLRLHFYAGVFVGPFILVAALTGDLTTYGTSGVLPLRMTLDQLHRNLLLGDDAAAVEIAAADRPGDAWTVREIDRSWPTQVDTVAVDAATGEVTDQVRFAEYPLGAKLARWGIDLHMGTLFGWPNRVVLAAVGAGLTAVTVLGYRLWWQRRPGRAAFGRPVPRGRWRGLPRWGLLAAAASATAVGLLAPPFGLSLLAFLIVDVLIGRLVSRGRQSGAEADSTA